MIELSTYEMGALSLGSVIAGIYMLVLGGNWAIDAAVAISERANLSKVFIGATVIAFGTSIPELFTSVNANAQGYPGISLGNIIGSNIANVLLVLGVAALICTLSVNFRDVAKDIGIMLIATAILIAGVWNGVIGSIAGLLMFALLLAFVAYQYFSDDIDISEVEDIEMSKSQSALLLSGGFVFLAVGSELLVRGAVVTGAVLGVPEAVIGMTAVAIGTSLPELTASIAAASKRETDMMFGNILGSNTFNILSIVALTAASKPLIVERSISEGIDLYLMAGVSVGLVLMLIAGVKITRIVGVAFLLAYAAFIAWQLRLVV